MAGETAAGVAAGEVLVGAAGPVEVAAAGDVEDAPPHGHVHGHVVGAVVGQQDARGEGAEDDGGRLARERGLRRRLVEEVGRVQRDGGEDEVQRRRESGAGRAVSYLAGCATDA